MKYLFTLGLSAVLVAPVFKYFDGLSIELPSSEQSQSEKDSESSPTVLVIGAGLAGLTSAYELEQKNYKVSVLEASKTAGGRVKSKKFANGQVAEGGGELIDAKSIHPQMHKYLDTFGLKTDDVGYDDEKITDGAYYINNTLFPDYNFEMLLGSGVAASEKKFWNALAKLAEEVPNPTEPQKAKKAQALDAKSALEWINSLNLHPTVTKVALHHVRAEYGEPANVSLLFLAQQQKAYENIEDEEIEIYRIKGGSSTLINGFVNHIKGEKKFNSPVVSIKQTDDTVTATTKDGKKYEADYAVVSVPATVLHKIKFEPKLDSDKEKASKELAYGHHNKVLMQYKTRFWLKRKLGGDVLSELPIGWVWEATDQQEGDKGILVAYTSGDVAKSEKNLSDKELIDKRKAEIETMYPEAKNKLLISEVYRWDKNPWIQGGYTAYAPKQVMSFWGVFNKPHQRVYFAGEHTDDLLPGYMEGAVRSGQRVAQQISVVNGDSETTANKTEDSQKDDKAKQLSETDKNKQADNSENK